MRIAIDTLRDVGLALGAGEMGPWALRAASEGLDGEVRALAGRLELNVFGAEVRATGALEAVRVGACDRCTGAIEARIGGPIDLVFVPSGSRGDASRELASDEMDVGFYEEGAVDLGALVREHFALLRPIRLACDSAGVRPLGGEPCAPSMPQPEDDTAVDPRFAALAGLKFD
jgi:uncharacterized metal-binding protein YceD (DUF177 family)